MAIKGIDYNKCNHCAKCYDTCPMDVFRRVGELVYVAYPDDCMTCFLCEMDCDRGAIVIDPWRARDIVQTW